MVIAERPGRVDQVHRAGTVSLGAEAGIKAPPETFLISTSSQEQIFEQKPEIEGKIKELDKVSVRWIKAKLSGGSGESEEEEAGDTGEMLRKIIKDVTLPSSIGEMYDNLFQNVGEEGTVAMQSSGQNEIFLQQGKKGVRDPIKEFLADRFSGEAVRRRNEARLEMLQKALRDNPDIDRALQESEVLSHAKSNLPVVVQRWRM